MDKQSTFSNETKNLIWKRFVQPANGTMEEAEHFIEVCEQFGLNPLLGDIVYQRFETRNGARSNFITTRDGLLRVATSQPGYVGPPNANVVKEGDDFEFLPAEGTVKHKFGSKRGKILGAYAIMKHKEHNPVAVFVDFDEYYQANSGKINNRYGNLNVWDKMPSAMIVKTAETFVLKRQFPLGGLYTQEEMGLEENLNDIPAQQSQSPKQQSPKPKQEQSQPKIKKTKADEKPVEQLEKATVKIQAFNIKKSARGGNYGLLDVVDVNSNKQQNLLVRNEDTINLLQQTNNDSEANVSIKEENSFFFLEEIEIISNGFNSPSEPTNESSSETTKPAAGSETEETTSNETSSENTKDKTDQPTGKTQEQATDYDVVQGTIGVVESGKKGQTKFVKMALIKDDGEKMNLITNQSEYIEQALQLEKDQQVALKVKNENGFNFFVGLDSKQQAG